MSTTLKLQAFEALMTELSAALADIAETLQNGQASSEEISTTLVDLLSLMTERKDDSHSMDGVTAAIQALRITVAPARVTVKNNIEVCPTPIQNIVNTPAPLVQLIERPPVDYDVKWTYDGMGRIESTRLIAQPRKAAP